MIHSGAPKHRRGIFPPEHHDPNSPLEKPWHSRAQPSAVASSPAFVPLKLLRCSVLCCRAVSQAAIAGTSLELKLPLGKDSEWEARH